MDEYKFQTLSPPHSTFQPTAQLTMECLNRILATMPPGFVLDSKLDLFVHLLDINQAALAWTEEEHGTFSTTYFPDYEIPVIEHILWACPPIKIPMEAKLQVVTQHQIDASNYEHSSALYRAVLFPVMKKNSKLCMSSTWRTLML
ncbi:hypothetical protein FOMPIDRAFT_59869 [Fomitopsis schrenkii]|uniref:Uncharacterized protein n=1 Tax=Fomitopsis schrenkii TaxID=2126942 RepID=S8DVF6_FOMSC|nr:hypothetical protein FOMPIDRAFT_59869 [Fomitopsis schrenkii]